MFSRFCHKLRGRARGFPRPALPHGPGACHGRLRGRLGLWCLFNRWLRGCVRFDEIEECHPFMPLSNCAIGRANSIR